MSENLLLFVISQIIAAGAVYAAIRADLRELMVRMGHAEKRIERLEEGD